MKKMIRYLWDFRSESKSIQTVFVWSIFVGIFYSLALNDKFSLDSLKDIASGSFIVTFFGGVYLRMKAAERREVTGSLTKSIDLSLENTRNELIRSFARQDYENKKSFYRTLMTIEPNESYWKYKFRMETGNYYSIRILEDDTSYHYRMDILGEYVSYRGGIESEYYIIQLSNNNQNNRPLENNKKYAVWYGHKMYISKKIEGSNSDIENKTLEFKFSGKVGHAYHPDNRLVNDFTKDEIAIRSVDKSR